LAVRIIFLEETGRQVSIAGAVARREVSELPHHQGVTRQILTLYDLLLSYDSSPVIKLNHAIALSISVGLRLH
jgi:predicted RNA polymerase sigma factor